MDEKLMTEEEKERKEKIRAKRAEQIKKYNFRLEQERDPEAFRLKQIERGKKAGKVLKEKKAMRDQMRMILGLKPAKNDKLAKQAKEMGVPEIEVDNQLILMVSLFKRARTGDVQAIREIRGILGELTPVEIEEQKPFQVEIVLASEKLAKEREENNGK